MSLVLVADDEPAVLEVLSEVVEDLGHEVVRAHDGAEALRLARARGPHLVVTDHIMPRLSGAELCGQLARDPLLHGVPVILLSAMLEHRIPEAHAFLHKPFEISEFEMMVREALHGVASPAAPVRPETTVPGRWLVDTFEAPLQALEAGLRALRPDRLPAAELLAELAAHARHLSAAVQAVRDGASRRKDA